LKPVVFCLIFSVVVVYHAEIALANSAPVVSNVTVSQRTDGSKKVDIRYNLTDADGDKCTISVQVSSDGGSTWTVPATSVSGAIGGNISPGSGKVIVWDAGADLPGVFGSNYRVKVMADDTPIPVDMVYIPAGTFQMGNSIAGEGYSDELPLHTVTLSSFYMGRCDITNGQYCAYLNSAYQQGLITVTSGVVYKAGSGTSYPYCDTSTYNSGSQIAFSGGVFTVRTKGSRSMANDPMVCVSWYGSVAYCNWRSQQEGKDQCYDLSTWVCNFSKKGYRLATEAQWEYAARGGLSGKRFPWGDTITHSQANYYSDSSYSYDISPTRGFHPSWNDGIYPYTSPVGSFAANGYGLCDMAGNVWQWCNDWYGSYSSSPQTNPTGPASGSWRVLRGGGWYFSAGGCRTAGRSYDDPYYRSGDDGFRVSLDLN
jgi:formylglycine-generating enzyme required for sulfatase activity